MFKKWTINRDFLEELFNESVTIDKAIPLVGEVNMDELEDINNAFEVREILQAMDIVVPTNKEHLSLNDLVEFAIDNDKFGMIARIAVRNMKYDSETTATSTCGFSIYCIYTENYEELLHKALEIGKKQHENELNEFRKLNNK